MSNKVRRVETGWEFVSRCLYDFSFWLWHWGFLMDYGTKRSPFRLSLLFPLSVGPWRSTPVSLFEGLFYLVRGPYTYTNTHVCGYTSTDTHHTHGQTVSPSLLLTIRPFRFRSSSLWSRKQTKKGFSEIFGRTFSDLKTLGEFTSVKRILPVRLRLIPVGGEWRASLGSRWA